MKLTSKIISAAASAIAALLAVAPASAQPFGQWNFDAGNLSASVGSPMTFRDAAAQAATTFGSTAGFGIPGINGNPANVMSFPAATNGTMGYNLPTPGANGGGSLLNDYTLLLDVLYPASSAGRVRPIAQTDDGQITPAADLVIDASNGIGTAEGPFFGAIVPNTWHRIAFVVHGSARQIRMYIDGLEVGSRSIPDAFDSRFALNPGATAQILNNNDTNAAPGYVNSIQLRDVALSSGQIQALGAASVEGIPEVIPAVPSFVQSRSPAIGAVGVGPKPNLNAVVDQGDTTINSSTIKLYFDGTLQPATVSGLTANRYTVDHNYGTILEPLSVHAVSLVYQDSVAGSKTNTWTFQVANYQSVTLPAPIVLEDFDSVAEGSLPAGWSVTNATTVGVPGLDLGNPNSDSYLDFVVISSNRMSTIFGGAGNSARRGVILPITVNGQLLDGLAHGNLLYAESDVRGGNQVQAAFSPDYNMTGRSNIFVAWYSTYEQNQDSLGAVEYSTDAGATWDPVIYMLDDENGVADVLRFPDGSIDGFSTMNRVQANQAYGTNFGAYIGVTSDRWASLSNFISPRINDDSFESKRVEIVRLPKADNSAAVRFRILQTGTASWYFGVDNFGLYSINTPVISKQPVALIVDAGTAATFSVVASGSGTLNYQWRRNGNNIAGANSASFTIPSTTAGDAGLYSVVVSNADGPTTSSPAQLTVITAPQLLSNPISQVADVGGSVSLSVTARGGQPLSYLWHFNGTLQSAGTSRSNVLNNLQTANSGSYFVIVSNSFGMATSAVARVVVVSDAPGSGNITQGLVAHLRFDGDNTDSSGRNNHGTAVGAPAIAAGKIGSGALEFTSAQDGSSFNYVTLGKPADLNFGDTNDFSVSFWAKLLPGTWKGDPAFIGNKNWNGGGNVGWVAAANGGGEFQWNYREPAPNERRDFDGASGTFGNNNWHHIAMVFVRGGFAYTYIDGVQVGAQSMQFGLNPPTSIDTSGLATPLDMNIGQDGVGSYTDGGSVGITNALIDDVGIWRRALTPGEAVGIYLRGLTNSDLTTASAGLSVPPSISAQPVSLTTSAGGSASFTIGAGGTAPLTYQWLKNGANIGGANAASLTLSGVTVGDEADYSVRISNSAGSVTSATARLRVFNGTLNQDLVAYLKFNGDYRDFSGRGNHAAPRGTPTFEAGQIGQALRVTSSSDLTTANFATLGYPGDLQFGEGDFSVMFWVNIISHGSDPVFISNKDWDSASNIGWVVADQGSPNNLRVNATGTPRGSGNRMNATLAGPSFVGGWHHVVSTFWRGQNTATYVDGALVNTTPLTIAGSVDTLTNGAPATFAVNIGQDGGGRYEGAPLDALMDDVLLYRRVVTPQEVSSLYAAGAAGQDLILHILTVTTSGTDATLTWSGGTAPYKVERKTSLNDATWVEVGTTSDTTATVPTGGSPAFFRVRSN